jgi:hypothetical protein
MTARQEARVRTRGVEAGSWSYEAQRAPHVGEILQTARERKGVDLARAERETKIRARHLAALESGDFGALPAQVYAKGFLRNYSTYLGLDAEEMLARWRREVDQPVKADTPKVKPPPQPITAPGRGLKFTGGLLVALVLATIVFLFVGYIGLQLVRFTQNPELALNGPSIRQLQPGAERVTLSGTGTPDAVVTATGADDLVRTTTANPRGAWSLDLPGDQGTERLHDHQHGRPDRARVRAARGHGHRALPRDDGRGVRGRAGATGWCRPGEPLGRTIGGARVDLPQETPPGARWSRQGGGHERCAERHGQRPVARQGP